MYEAWTRLLIVFLTHPGILVSMPANGLIMSWGRGLLQAGIVLAMHGASETKWSQMVQYLYWGTFFLWAWLKVEVADKAAIAKIFPTKQ